MNYVEGFKIAWTMFTTIPLFKTFKENVYGESVAMYPLVGFILGAFVYGVYIVLTPLLPPLHLSVLLFVIYTLLYGALHVDGFADVVDGWFASFSKEPLAVMKDSHIGAMGVVFVFLLMALKLSSVVHLSNMAYIIPVLMLSRYAVLIGIYFFPYKGRGMGSLPKQQFKKEHLVVASIYTSVVALLFFGLSAVFYLLLSVLSVVLLSRLFVKKFGTLNGDMYGATIELTELALLQLLLILQ